MDRAAPVDPSCLRHAALRIGKRLLALSALALAVWLVRHELGGISLRDVAAAIRATPAWALLASAAFTAASYASLVAAEWCAFRYVGHPQPWRKMALRSFSAHALASNLGFGLVSGAAARLRLYRSLGLDAKEIGGLSVRVSTAIFLSGAVTLGITMTLLAPVSHRSSLTLAAVATAIVLLAPAALWFLDLGRLGGGHDSRLGLRGRALALAASIGDWVFSGAALAILSNQGAAGFPVFLAVFVSGSLAGSLLGLPAALGVLDASVLGAAALSGKTPEAAAALLLYRVIYFLGPQALAGAGSAVRWARRAARLRSS